MKNILIIIILIVTSTDLSAQTILNPNLFICGRDSLPTNGQNVTGNFLFFEQSAGAFRGGYIEDSERWSPDSLGFASFGYGYSVKASGANGVAMGFSTQATGELGAIALGYSSKASGLFGATALGLDSEASGSFGATALGYGTIASGNSGATALGFNTTASGNSCTAVGMYNDPIVASRTLVSRTSPIFIVGNGNNDTTRTNALVITKSGKIGIGDNTPSAAINHFNGAKLTVTGIWADASDISKKYNVEPLQDGLETISKLNPVSYHYLSDDSPSIGFVAQELEKILPEMVFGEEGDKSVGYGQITAVLTKAMQEQQIIIEDQDKSIQNLQEELQLLKNLVSSISNAYPTIKPK